LGSAGGSGALSAIRITHNPASGCETGSCAISSSVQPPDRKIAIDRLPCRGPRRGPHMLYTASAQRPILDVQNVSKTYGSGFCALKNINLSIKRGEIFALLGPNGAGKTTLIGIICGLVNASEGTVAIDGHDIIADYRAARALVGLV